MEKRTYLCLGGPLHGKTVAPEHSSGESALDFKGVELMFMEGSCYKGGVRDLRSVWGTSEEEYDPEASPRCCQHAYVVREIDRSCIHVLGRKEESDATVSSQMPEQS